MPVLKEESLNKLSINGLSASAIYLKQVVLYGQKKKKNRKIKAKLKLVKQSVNNLPWKREQSKIVTFKRGFCDRRSVIYVIAWMESGVENENMSAL